MCIRDRYNNSHYDNQQAIGTRTTEAMRNHISDQSTSTNEMAVSYTHLDVYKRQNQEDPTFPECGERCQKSAVIVRHILLPSSCGQVHISIKKRSIRICLVEHRHCCHLGQREKSAVASADHHILFDKTKIQSLLRSYFACLYMEL